MKILNRILIFATMAVMVASCGKEEDYTLKDITPLIGTYSGDCVISSLNFPKEMKTTLPTEVRFAESSDAKTLMLETKEFGFVTPKAVIKNFKTSKDGKSYTFSLDGFERSWAATPLFITEWYEIYFSSIKSVKATMKPSGGVYDIATKTLTFTYDAKTTVVGMDASGEGTQTKTITFQYTVTKKD